jgi:hypothetical protein
LTWASPQGFVYGSIGSWPTSPTTAAAALLVSLMNAYGPRLKAAGCKASVSHGLARCKPVYVAGKLAGEGQDEPALTRPREPWTAPSYLTRELARCLPASCSLSRLANRRVPSIVVHVLVHRRNGGPAHYCYLQLLCSCRIGSMYALGLVDEVGATA